MGLVYGILQGLPTKDKTLNDDLKLSKFDDLRLEFCFCLRQKLECCKLTDLFTIDRRNLSCRKPFSLSLFILAWELSFALDITFAWKVNPL